MNLAVTVAVGECLCQILAVVLGILLLRVSPLLHPQVVEVLGTTGLAFGGSAGVLVGMAQSGCTYAIVYGVIGRNVPAEKRSWAMGITAAAGSFGQNRSGITPCGMYMKPNRTGGFDFGACLWSSAHPMVSSSGSPSATPSPRRQVRRLIKVSWRMCGLS